MLLLLAIFVVLGTLHLRMAHLQLIEGAHWRQMAENNRLRRLPLAAVRGRIYDRRGQVLADNLPAWNLLLFPDEARNLNETVVFVADLGVGGAASLLDRVNNRSVDRLAPMVVGENLDWNQVARVRSHQSDHPELSIVAGFRRHYPLGPAVAHAVGHLRMVSEEELAASPRLDPNSRVGAIGVEALANDFLTGRTGERWVVVSAVGRQLGVVRESPSTSGKDLAVTLDADLQQVAAQAMGERGGAVAAIDPNNGAVRILYSAPSFNPELFSGKLSTEDWSELSNDPRLPLQDRCLQGTYPPGSTIKPFLALAALTEGVITPDWSVHCSGGVVLHGHRFRCWRRGGHGKVNLSRSLEASCDVYYYQLGQRLGIDRMAGWLETFGFGRRTGIGLPSEASGLIGSPEWSRRVRGTPWYPGEAVSVSIGQGPVLATAIQLARGFACPRQRRPSGHPACRGEPGWRRSHRSQPGPGTTRVGQSAASSWWSTAIMERLVHWRRSRWPERREPRKWLAFRRELTRKIWRRTSSTTPGLSVGRPSMIRRSSLPWSSSTVGEAGASRRRPHRPSCPRPSERMYDPTPDQGQER